MWSSDFRINKKKLQICSLLSGIPKKSVDCVSGMSPKIFGLLNILSVHRCGVAYRRTRWLGCTQKTLASLSHMRYRPSCIEYQPHKRCGLFKMRDFQSACFSTGDEPVKSECGASATCGGLCPPLPQVLEQPLTAQPGRLQVSSSQCSIFYYWLLLILILDSFLKTFWLIQF